MKKGFFTTLILIILALIIIGLIWFLRTDTLNTINNGNNNGTNATSTATTTTSNPLIRVNTPSVNATVASPLIITGEARGNWYFEASFPVKLIDANGQELAVAPAQAQGDWMTTNFVPFKLTLNFATPTTPTGTLILEKDNPSGLPENAAEIRIPVRFSPTASGQTRVAKLYFYNSNKDKDTNGTILCSAQGLVPVERTLAVTNTPIQDTIKELLKGPTSSERNQLIGTEFPLSGFALTGANLSAGVLTLNFADPNNQTTGGSCRVSVLKAQIEATAKQFVGINTVRLTPSTLFQP
jgi:hypothetical protein